MLTTVLRLGSRSAIKNYQPRFNFSKWNLPAFEIDAAGISGFFQSRTSTYLTLSQKFAEIRPGSLYTGLDEWTRQLLVTLSTDMGCGFATTIILTTIVIKTIFLYPTMRGQLQGLRQAELKQLSSMFQEKMKTAQMTRNKILMSQASYEYKMSMKKRGINNVIPLINLLQIPLLLTWFFSLRYMSNLPQIFPQMLTEGHLWFTDLSTYDPYFVLPVTAAIFTSFSISRSPNLARNKLSIPLIAPYIKYLKYLPFASLAFTAFFPASINLYWMVLASYQLMITQMMHIQYFRTIFSGVKRSQAKKKVQFDGAVFVNQKKTSEQIMTNSALKVEQRRQQFMKKSSQKGREMSINEVKVSFNKIKRKKNSDDK